jgi:serine-type D-Ala-D-Ala carboxypeptidase/endopeptidase (penicillin-binding protein 4)
LSVLALLALLLSPQLFDTPTLRGATVTAYAIDAQSGAILYERDPDVAMMPASALKLLVGSAALDLLGPTFSFTTTLASDGTTLYLRGSGDPLLEPDDFVDAAQTLSDLDATHFDALVGDTTATSAGYPDGWVIDDLPNDYAAPPNALSMNENASDGKADLDPAHTTLETAAATLTHNGVTIGNAAQVAATPVNAHVLWTHHSQPLPQLLRSMWWPSDNLLAESLLDAFAPTRAAALDRERAWLRTVGIDPATTTLADGSGLSTYDRITARDLVTVLARDWNGPHRTTVLDALPVAGEHGTLEDVFTAPPLAGAVVAKTGSMNHTRTLAGYMLTPHGTVIFALLVNGWMDDGPKASANLRAFQAAFMEPFFE